MAAGHTLRRTPLLSRLSVLIGVAVIAGLAAAGIGDAISGLGHYWAIAGTVALFSLAVSAPTAALGCLRPPSGSARILAFLIFAIPVSCGPPNLAAFGPSFLRSLTGVLPLENAANTIRNTVYFHDGNTTGHVLVLTAYALGGLVALSLFSLVRQIASERRAHDADSPGQLLQHGRPSPPAGGQGQFGAPRLTSGCVAGRALAETLFGDEEQKSALPLV